MEGLELFGKRYILLKSEATTSMSKPHRAGQGLAGRHVESPIKQGRKTSVEKDLKQMLATSSIKELQDGLRSTTILRKNTH